MKLTEILEESEASEEAKKNGLVSKGWGRWADKEGNVVAQTDKGKLKWIYAKEPSKRDASYRQPNPNPMVRDEEHFINKAATLAIKAHGDQMYGNKPYKYHLKKVYDNAVRYGGTTAARVAAVLHDTLEDTQLSKEEIAKEFSPKVAHIVDLLSNRPSKQETFQRIRTDPTAVFVKLCDRLANVQEGQKNDKYRKEHPLFKQELHTPGEYDTLWYAIEKALGVQNEKPAV